MPYLKQDANDLSA